MPETLKTYERSIRLTDAELLLLDGKVRPAVQAVVDEAKAASACGIGDTTFAEIIRRATVEGKLTERRRYIGTCRGCDATTTYVKFQKGRNRGQTDWKRPIKVYGTSFMDGIVTMENHSSFGYCHKCEIDASNRIHKYIIDHDLPIELPGKDSKWVKEAKLTCRECKKEMWEFDMGLSPTMMGDGFYYSKCPHCSAQSSLFQHHDHTPEKRAVEIKTLTNHKGCWQRKGYQCNCHLHISRGVFEAQQRHLGTCPHYTTQTETD